MGPPQSFLSNLADQEGAEVGVIVVAENEHICEEALRALIVEWEELLFVVDLELLETRAGNACYGGNGISHFLANTHLVIMAIHNAIGKWVESPATPEKILKALGKG